MSVRVLERRLFEATLAEADDNKPHTARQLGVSACTLWYKLRKPDIK